jgi:urease accessory protein
LARDISFTSPFKITHPFYEEKTGLLRIMTIAVAAGIMAGDAQDIEISVGTGAEAEVFSQAFEKIHKMEDGQYATRDTHLIVASDARLIYAPLPVIPFAASDFRGEMVVALADDSSRLLLSDVVTSGRVAMGESFQYHSFRNRTRIYRAGDLIYNDNLVIKPAELGQVGVDPSDFCLFEGYTHQSTVLVADPVVGEAFETKVNELLAAEGELAGAATTTGHGLLCVRMLANESEPLLHARDRISKLIDEMTEAL